MLRFFLLCIVWALLPPTTSFRRINISGTAQGTTYHITYYAADSIITRAGVDSVLNRIDSSLSLYKPYSLISRFNQSATGIEMDEHMEKVFKKSIYTWKATGGIFDITVQPLVQAWGFGPKKIAALPDSVTIKRILACIGSQWLQQQGRKLLKKKPCIRIDMNGIAQGYTVDVLAAYFEAAGVKNYIVEVGGEIRVKGRKQPSNEKMRIGIESPGEDEFEMSMIQTVISPDSGAVTTSGSYRKFYESGGKRISHIIDPRTGYSSQSNLISVTVYARDAITADAFDNALMVMGLDSALHFTEKRKDIAAYFIYRKPSGAIADSASSRFQPLIVH